MEEVILEEKKLEEKSWKEKLKKMKNGWRFSDTILADALIFERNNTLGVKGPRTIMPERSEGI